MDMAYCTGGEGAYDGTPTYWGSSVRADCKKNPAGEDKPYGRKITKDEFERYTHPGMVQCPDGSWDIPNGIVAPCLGHGGQQPQQPPIEFFLPSMQDMRTGAFFCSDGYMLRGDKCYPQTKMVCGGYLGFDGNGVFTKPNNQGEMIARYIGGRCDPIGYAR
jgi:hypothetical protein